MAVSVGDILDATVIEHAQFGTWVRLPDGHRALLELPFIAKGKKEVTAFQRETDRGSTIPVTVILVDADGDAVMPRIAVSMLEEHYDIGKRWRAAKERWPLGARAAAEVKLIALGRVFVDLKESFLGVIRKEENPEAVERLAAMIGSIPSRPLEQMVYVEVIGYNDRQAEFLLRFKRFMGKKPRSLPQADRKGEEQLELIFPE